MSDWVEYGSVDEISQSFALDKKRDQSVVEDVVLAWQKQAEHIQELRDQQYAAIRAHEWDELNRLHTVIWRLERGEVTSEPTPDLVHTETKENHAEPYVPL